MSESARTGICATRNCLPIEPGTRLQGFVADGTCRDGGCDVDENRAQRWRLRIPPNRMRSAQPAQRSALAAAATFRAASSRQLDLDDAASNESAGLVDRDFERTPHAAVQQVPAQEWRWWHGQRHHATRRDRRRSARRREDGDAQREPVTESERPDPPWPGRGTARVPVPRAGRTARTVERWCLEAPVTRRITAPSWTCSSASVAGAANSARVVSKMTVVPPSPEAGCAHRQPPRAPARIRARQMQVADRRRTARLSHPLYAEAMRADDTTVDRLRSTLRRLADLLEATGARRSRRPVAPRHLATRRRRVHRCRAFVTAVREAITTTALRPCGTPGRASPSNADDSFELRLLLAHRGDRAGVAATRPTARLRLASKQGRNRRAACTRRPPPHGQPLFSVSATRRRQPCSRAVPRPRWRVGSGETPATAAKARTRLFGGAAEGAVTPSRTFSHRPQIARRSRRGGPRRRWGLIVIGRPRAAFDALRRPPTRSPSNSLEAATRSVRCRPGCGLNSMRRSIGRADGCRPKREPRLSRLIGRTPGAPELRWIARLHARVGGAGRRATPVSGRRPGGNGRRAPRTSTPTLPLGLSWRARPLLRRSR